MIAPDARPLRAAGLSTVPLPYGKKAPPPLAWDRFCHTPPTDEEFSALFDDGDKHNIGVACGPASGGVDVVDQPYTAGLVVLIFNNRRFYEQFANGKNLLRWTWCAESYRGPHVYIRLADELPPRTLYFNAGPSFPSVLELRTTGSYVVAPQSLHPSGVVYTWWEPRPREIVTLELDELRLWFAECRAAAANRGWPLREGPANASQRATARGSAGHANPNVPRVLPETIRGPDGEQAGERHYVLVSLAGTLRRRGLDATEIEACLTEVNARRCEPPCPERDVARIARSVAKYSPDELEARPDLVVVVDD